MANFEPENIWTPVLSSLIQCATALFLNGICVLLGVLACYFLCRRGTSLRCVLFWAVVMTSSLATMQMIHQLVSAVQLVQLHRSFDTVGEQRELLLLRFERLSASQRLWDKIFILVSNVFTDCIFMYRYYVVSGNARYTRRLLSLSLLLVIVTTIFGVLTSLLPWNPRASSIVVGVGMISANLLLTGLTAGRIWWMRRCVIQGNPQLVHRSNTAITLLLESSALYFVLMLTVLLVELVGSPDLLESPGFAVVNGGSVQIMNILPALLIVRVSVERTVDVDPTCNPRAEV
ncbi:hypothetical protein R3P38DRAFT_1534189 [Favolaschia claudopus]|uniref:Uncharacterized protein n=1 Tax=Favolaschia claudopus TaxID=2862362 RepID=A0AAW0AK66_9AGAR